VTPDWVGSCVLVDTADRAAAAAAAAAVNK